MTLSRYIVLFITMVLIGSTTVTVRAQEAQKEDEETIALDENTIKLGAVISTTGKYATYGKYTKDGYDLAVELINARGGITIDGKRYDLQIVYYNDESIPEQAARLTARLIKKEGIKYMLGPYGSILTHAVASITENHQVPMIVSNGIAGSLFNEENQYLFAVVSSADLYLASAVDLLAEKASALDKSASDMKIALAFEGDAFSQEIRLGVVEAAREYGMKIVVDEMVPETLDDISGILDKVKQATPEGFFISSHSKGAITATRQIRDFGIDVPMIAMTHCHSAEIEKHEAHAAEYTLCAYQWHKQLTYRDDDGLFGNGEDFAQVFNQKYGYEPPYQAAQSAAAVQLWSDAFSRAQSLDSDILRDTIAITEMQSFYGNIAFNDVGENIAKPMAIGQILDGEYKVVAPTKWSENEVVFPKPKWSER